MSVLAPEIFAKQSAEVKAYALGFSGKMLSTESLAGIVSTGFEVVRGRHVVSDAVIDSQYLSTDKKSVVLVISGGSDRTLYKFFATANTDVGNTYESDGLLYVDDAKLY